jgi:hypothetical protein
MTDDAIDYFRIAKSQSFYRALGYKSIETPWLVSEAAVQATLPTDSRSLGVFRFDEEEKQTPFGSLVASGEQGFIQMMMDGKLQPGRYQTTTPCFRDEKSYNTLTRFSFLKVELIWYMPDDSRLAYETVLNNAVNCFFEISDLEDFEAVPTEDGYDLTYKGIELGSYGVRQMDSHIWVYGTGLAEPRFSTATRRPQEAAISDSISA